MSPIFILMDHILGLVHPERFGLLEQMNERLSIGLVFIVKRGGKFRDRTFEIIRAVRTIVVII